MKKLIAGLFAAILTTAGLVAVSSSVPASAACTSYVCVNTRTVAKSVKTVKVGTAVKIKVTVSVSGTAPVRGSVLVTLKGPGGFSKAIRARYADRPVTLNAGKFKKPGKYAYTVKFTGVEGFRDSQAKGTITVKKKRRA